MKRLIELYVNGESHELAVEPHATLLEILSETLGLTGTKEACGTGECGSCTVLVGGKPILSCLTLAVDCLEQEIVTIEGLADEGDQLTPLQRSFHDCGAIQCGFCTPGMIISATALLKEDPRPSEAEIKKALEGNLCRCTGYNKIIEAIHKTAEKMATKQEVGEKHP